MLDIDCAADSLTIVIEKQKEIIKSYQSKVDSLSHIENHTEFVNVVPSYYESCTKGFWWLLGIDLLVIAIIVLYFVGKMCCNFAAQFLNLSCGHASRCYLGWGVF